MSREIKSLADLRPAMGLPPAPPPKMIYSRVNQWGMRAEVTMPDEGKLVVTVSRDGKEISATKSTTKLLSVSKELVDHCRDLALDALAAAKNNLMFTRRNDV